MKDLPWWGLLALILLSGAVVGFMIRATARLAPPDEHDQAWYDDQFRQLTDPLEAQ